MGAVETVFRNRNLCRLETAWAAFNLAEYAFVIALGLLAFDRGGAAAVGLIALIRTLPAIGMTTFSRGNRFGRYLGWGLLLMGTGLLLAGVWPALVTVLIGFLLVGIAGSQIDISAQTLLQRTVSEDHLGRVLGIFEGLYWGALGVGGLLAGLLISATDVGTTVVAAGVALMVVAVGARGPLQSIDRSIEVPDDRIDLFSQSEVFGLLPIPTQEHLARSAATQSVPPGTVIIEQGEAGTKIFLIEDGAVSVEVDGEVLATLGPGEVFGEIAALRDRSRTATVRAIDRVVLLVVDGSDFVAAVAAHASSANAAEAMVAGRLTGIGRLRRGRGH